MHAYDHFTNILLPNYLSPVSDVGPRNYLGNLFAQFEQYNLSQVKD
jgi:hypothetical protein